MQQNFATQLCPIAYVCHRDFQRFPHDVPSKKTERNWIRMENPLSKDKYKLWNIEVAKKFEILFQ